MNNRREFREIIKVSREGSAQQPLLPKLFGALRLFILFFLLSSTAFAQNLLNNKQYDLNDPRNPDCPCHKLQKLADDEYNRQQNGTNQFVSNFNKIDLNDNVDNQINIQQNFNPVNDNLGNDNESTKNKFHFEPRRSNGSLGLGISSGRNKKKKTGNYIMKKIYRAKIKHSKIKKAKPNYSVCYKW